jgi:hypothetical protein
MGECWGPFSLGYESKRIKRKKRKNAELRGRHSDCYWVEVRKRVEKTKRSPRKKYFG